MSLIAEPYCCDVCGEPKREANHWWLGGSLPSGAAVSKWDSRMAAKSPGVAHLCGVECAQIWVARQLGQIIAGTRSASRPARPTNDVVDKSA